MSVKKITMIKIIIFNEGITLQSESLNPDLVIISKSRAAGIDKHLCVKPYHDRSYP